MDYWSKIVQEVLARDEEGAKFRYTNLGESRDLLNKRVRRRYVRKGSTVSKKHYFLGRAHPGIYFTQREMECICLLLEGNTLVQVATVLNLSPRTIEFYVRNMKMKLRCQTKDELLEKVQHTDLPENFGSVFKSSD